MQVGILGRGRLGRSLERLLPSAGVSVVSWSRGQPFPAADLYWLCVPDREIAAVAAGLPADTIALHSAGSLGPEALLPVRERAVLHPLMTFPGPEHGLPDLRGVPATAVGTAGALAAATALGEALGLRILAIDGDRRRYHAAASVASSHVAAVFLSAARILEGVGLQPQEAREALLPLALESLRRAQHGASAITGPTPRGDRATEAAHRAALTPEERRTYDAIQALILKLMAERTDGSSRVDEVSIVGS